MPKSHNNWNEMWGGAKRGKEEQQKRKFTRYHSTIRRKNHTKTYSYSVKV